RVLDYNQININGGGFLTDFLKAQANFNLTGNAFCTTAGCQPLSVFGTATTSPIRVGTGGVALATFNANLQGGTPADLALSVLQANADFNPNITANPQFPL